MDHIRKETIWRSLPKVPEGLRELREALPRKEQAVAQELLLQRNRKKEQTTQRGGRTSDSTPEWVDQRAEQKRRPVNA